jgi:hypothetical protein
MLDTPSTSKLYKALFSGCIPVVFVSFPSQLPFYLILDWSKIAIVVMKDLIRIPGKIDLLLAQLKKIRSNTSLLNSYKENVAKVAPLFDYSHWKWPSVYHLTLLQLKLSIQQDKKLLFLFPLP